MTHTKDGALFTAREMRQIKRILAVVLVLGPVVGVGSSKGIDALSPVPTPAVTTEQLDRLERRLERIESMLMENRR